MLLEGDVILCHDALRFVGAAGNGHRRSKTRHHHNTLFAECATANEVHPVLGSTASEGFADRLYRDATLKHAERKKDLSAKSSKKRRQRRTPHTTTTTTTTHNAPKTTNPEKTTTATTTPHRTPSRPRHSLRIWTHRRQSCEPPPGSFVSDEGRTIVLPPEEQNALLTLLQKGKKRKKKKKKTHSTHDADSSTEVASLSATGSSFTSAATSSKAGNWKTMSTTRVFTQRTKYIAPHLKQGMKEISVSEEGERERVVMEEMHEFVGQSKAFCVQAGLLRELRRLVGEEPKGREAVVEEEGQSCAFHVRTAEHLRGVVCSAWYVVESECELRHEIVEAEQTLFASHLTAESIGAGVANEATSARLLQENLLMKKAGAAKEVPHIMRSFIQRETVAREMTSFTAECGWQVLFLLQHHAHDRAAHLETDLSFFSLLFSACKETHTLYTEEDMARCTAVSSEAFERSVVHDFAGIKDSLRSEYDIAADTVILEERQARERLFCGMECEAGKAALWDGCRGECDRSALLLLTAASEPLARRNAVLSERTHRQLLSTLEAERFSRQNILSSAGLLLPSLALVSAESLHRRQQLRQEARLFVYLIQRYETVSRRRCEDSATDFLTYLRTDCTKGLHSMIRDRENAACSRSVVVEAALRTDITLEERRCFSRIEERGRTGLCLAAVLRRFRVVLCDIQCAEQRCRGVLVQWLCTANEEHVFRRSIHQSELSSRRGLLPYQAALNRRSIVRNHALTRWWLETSGAVMLYESARRNTMQHHRRTHLFTLAKSCHAQGEVVLRKNIIRDARQEWTKIMTGWHGDEAVVKLFEGEARRRRYFTRLWSTTIALYRVMNRSAAKWAKVVHDEADLRFEVCSVFLSRGEELSRSQLVREETYLRQRHYLQYSALCPSRKSHALLRRRVHLRDATAFRFTKEEEVAAPVLLLPPKAKGMPR